MDYLVRMTLNEKFIVNNEVLSKVLAGYYGENTGSTVDASIVEFKNRILSIRTAIQFIAENKQARWRLQHGVIISANSILTPQVW